MLYADAADAIPTTPTTAVVTPAAAILAIFFI